MADIKIRVTHQELMQAVNKFNQCKSEMAAAYGQMSAEVMTLNNYWDGPASQAFLDRFSQLVENIRTSDATIDQAMKGLTEAAEIFAEAEENISKQNMTQAPDFGG